MPVKEDFATTNRMMRSALGVSYLQRPGMIFAGIDKQGRAYYSDPKRANSADTASGSTYVDSFIGMLDPFGVLDGGTRSTLQQVGAISGDVAHLGTLTGFVQSKDPKGFVDYMLSTFKKPIINKLTDNPKSRAGLNAAVDAYYLFSNWNNLSDAQKTLGVARTGISAIDSLTGSSLRTTKIPGTESLFTGKGLTVGNALGLAAVGINAYSFAKNFKQLDTLGKLVYGTGTISQTAQLAKELGLLGNGPTGAAVTNVTAESLSALGATSAPSYGVGAISIPQGGVVPAGYTQIASVEGGSVAIPSGLESTSSISTTSTLANVAGVASIAAGAYSLYKGWGTGGEKGALNGGLGGTAIAAGLYTLGATNPFLLGGVVAASALTGLIKTGKHEDQVKRDSVRSFFKNAGLADDKWQFTLPDGSVADMGIDGGGGLHTYRHSDKKVKSDPDRDLYAYDIDYTNDLDFFAGMGGIALSRIATGQDSQEVKQIGSQLGNLALGKTGYNADLTPENFTSVMQNLRAMYAKMGIGSKEEAYALSNQAFAEERIDEMGLIQAQQSFNMIFDNDFKTATSLSAGRFKGAEVAGEATIALDKDNDGVLTGAEVDPGFTPKPGNTRPLPRPTPGNLQPTISTREEAIARNQSRFAQPGA